MIRRESHPVSPDMHGAAPRRLQRSCGGGVRLADASFCDVADCTGSAQRAYQLNVTLDVCIVCTLHKHTTTLQVKEVQPVRNTLRQ